MGTSAPEHAAPTTSTGSAFIAWFDDVGMDDVGRVGGKNASLGQMRSVLAAAGVRVPDGFAVTADAYWHVLDTNDLRGPISTELARLDEPGVELHEVGERIRSLLRGATMPEDLTAAIRSAYAELGERCGGATPDVAVRSSATAEDLPDASFAGQQESYLNVVGSDQVVAAVQKCIASLFTDRAISYRQANGFDHMRVALSAGVQQMVRSDRGASGVMFTIDTETGHPGSIVIDGAWGLGESVVKGVVDPDEWVVFKPTLGTAPTPITSRRLGSKQERCTYAEGGGTRYEQVAKADRQRFVLRDDQVIELARWAVAIEDAYARPMDIEWALDADGETLFIVQARPETVQSRAAGAAGKVHRILGAPGELLVEGMAVGTAVASGRACVLTDTADIEQFPDGGVLVTGSTDPDWVPAMRRASAIVTEHGGRTSHAAIVSRELGVPAVVGAHDATHRVPEGSMVTVSCCEGEVGRIYAGEAEVEVTELDPAALPTTETPVLLNLGTPAAAMASWQLPARGCGLARMEFIVGSDIGIHPMALVRSELLDPAERAAIARRSAGHASPVEFFVSQLASGIARIAASRHPDRVIVRLSDFKTNEYRNLVGGRHFEPHEENPMIGWRGASRYASDGYREGFALECRALRRVRDEVGLANVALMVPFCRTVEEADAVLAELARHGLERGRDGLEVFVMAEIPVNVLCAAEFAERFDGFSIGSNDLTQLVLGIDRDSSELAATYDERHPAVVRAIRMLIEDAHAAGRHVGFCGNAPSADPAFAALLVELGIDSISVTPDAFASVLEAVAAAEGAVAR